MKKRLLSLLLAVVLSLPLLLPTAATAVESDPEPTEATAADYNALYVQDGLIFAADFYETNSYWNGNVVEDVNHYVWTDTSARFGFTYKAGSIIAGALQMSKWEPFENVLSITNTATLTNNSKGGTTGQYVGVFTSQGDNVFALNNLRTRVSYSTVNGVRMMNVTSLGFLLSDLQRLRTANGSVVSFSAAVPTSATTITMMMTVPQFTDSYYYAEGGGGTFSVTHTYDEVTDSVKPRDSALSRAGVSFLPIKVTPAKVWDEATETYVDNVGGNKYIVGAVQRDGGSADPWTDFLNNENGGQRGGVSFYCATPGHLGVYVNNLAAFDAPVYFPNNGHSAVSGSGTMLKPNQRADQGTKLYAFRQYSREISAGEMARNHLADLCKWFKLDISALAKNGALDISVVDLTSVAVKLADYTMGDARATVAAALSEAIRSVELVGEGEDFELFRTAAKDGLLDATVVRALPETLRNEIYTAFATFYRANGTADAAACQAAVDAAIDTVMQRDYGDYYGKPPALTSEDFFADTTGLSKEAQHFAAVAKKFNMDMTPLVSVHESIRERVYLSFSDVHPDLPMLTPILAARLDETIEMMNDKYYAETVLDGLITFEGYQLRTFGGVGVRAVFSVDEEILKDLEDHGYTVTFGTLFRSGNSSGMEVVHKEDGGFTVAGNGPALEVAYRDGAFLGDSFMLNGKTCFAYVRSSYAAITQIAFRGFAAVEKGEDLSLVCYAETAGDTFGALVKMRDLATYCREEMGISAPGIQALCKTPLTTVYVDGKNLTAAGIVNDANAADAIAAFRAVIADATGTNLRLLDTGVTGTGRILLEKGETASIAYRDGDFVFTYTDDLTADMAAFRAALDSTAEEYAVEEGGTVKVNVSLFYSGQPLAVAEADE